MKPGFFFLLFITFLIGLLVASPLQAQEESGLQLSLSGASGFGDETTLPPGRPQHQVDDSSDSNNYVLWIIIPLIILSIGGRMLSSWLANRDRKTEGKTVISGPLGGTICPHCNRPYAIHLWSLKLVAFRLDRCPHCGKWGRVRRMPQELLHASVDAMEMTGSRAAASAAESEQDQLQRRLDDSRFDDSG